MFTPVSSTGSNAWSPQSSQDEPQPQPSQPMRPTQPTRQPRSAPTLSQVQGTPAGAAGAITPTEAQQLIDRYENGDGYPDDSTNASSLADLLADGLRGIPQDVVRFESQLMLYRQKIEALPQQERERYARMLEKGVEAYESATSDADRQKIARNITENVFKPVDAAYPKAMADPAQRVQQEFTPPFGAQYLGAAGQQQVALLAQLGKQFSQAKTPQERESLFRQAAEIRHTLQHQIQARIAQAKIQLDQQWAEADRELDAALEEAKDADIATPEGDFDNTSSYERLKIFGQKAFTSPRNVQEFQYQLQQHPEKFKELKDWYNDANARTEWARSSMLGDPLRRTPNLPPPLPDFTNTPTDDLRMGHYGQELLDRDRLGLKLVGEDEGMYHAASQRGPIENGYLAAHTPPKPLWQRRTEDGIGRFLIGMIPGVNLFTDWIVPADSLSPDERAGIDIASGVLGGMLGETKFPGGRSGKAREGHEGGEGGAHSPGEGGPNGKGTGEGRSGGTRGGGQGGPDGAGAGGTGGTAGRSGGTGGAPASGAEAPTGIRGVPDRYVSIPGEALTPDPQFRGIYRDSKGQVYIQQDGHTYAVRYDKDNGTWRVTSPEGGTRPSYAVRLDGNGNWEVNPDTGLAGGTKYTDEVGRRAYESWYSGSSYDEVGKELGVADTTARTWASRYAETHRLPSMPGDVRPGKIKGWMNDGNSMYAELSNGRPLQEVANRHTGGNTFMAYRSAMRYAKTSGADPKPVLRARLQEIDAEAAEGHEPQRQEPTPSQPTQGQSHPQPQVEPMTRQQYDRTRELYDQGQSPEQIAQETGVPQQWAEDVVHGRGYWSPSKQAYVEPIYDPEHTEAGPSAKRQRVEPEAPGTSGVQSAAQETPGWGRNELRQYIDDGSKLDNATFEDIYHWLNEGGPEPAGLQQEMIDQGFPDLTPQMVRDYLDPNSRAQFTTQQRIRIAQWLGL
ncbi:hypothetical protein GCT13_05820 [Paraburkholderia sp. CNPSo 3157]|uniref:Uncharacterized protein n=1 Tax=Paraburkholderia franconis TaxID=2654983 RepID=A0A7X1N7J8_9BURK|nr:hypothetical protein [Paraburkholderia franconis]MPW16461.1 hypothetical protein [Paraburkholderia franconis]